MSPILTGSDLGVAVSFYYKSYSTDYNEQFQVGYTTDENTTDASSFTYGETVTAPASWQEYSSFFPAGTKRIAIKYIYTDGYYLCLDDFSFIELSVSRPIDLSATNINLTKATLDWAGSQESYTLRYRHEVVADPSAPATVILTAGDVWGDGTGYQMLLDADATAYGTIIPEEGALTPGNASASTYAQFEYKIPENADGALNTQNIVLNNSITMQIPAGTYDWCITNPTPGDRMWIASSSGDTPGRYDDFVFEPGVTYEFTIQGVGSNDGVFLTITRPMSDWTVVENVTNPYELTGLNPNTYYEWQGQGNLAEGTTAWSETSNFTTLDGVIVTIGNTGYGSLYYGEKNLKVPEGVTAYTYTVTTKLVKSKAYGTGEVIPAGEAVVLKAETVPTTPTQYVFIEENGSFENDKDVNNKLKGSDDPEHITEGGTYYYGLAIKRGSNDPSTVGFYWIGNNGGAFKIGAHKAYLALDKTFAQLAAGSTEAKNFISLDDEEDPTGIENLNVDVNANEVIYNLAGQRINKMQKGVNIVNGKKILK